MVRQFDNHTALAHLVCKCYFLSFYTLFHTLHQTRFGTAAPKGCNPTQPIITKGPSKALLECMMNMSRAGAAGFATCARLISTRAGYNKAMKAHQPLLASWASAIWSRSSSYSTHAQDRQACVSVPVQNLRLLFQSDKNDYPGNRLSSLLNLPNLLVTQD